LAFLISTSWSMEFMATPRGRSSIRIVSDSILLLASELPGRTWDETLELK
jgi:hypothetical protein